MNHIRSPYLYDELDRQLLSLLRQDGRAPVTQLATQLKVSRATIQNRIDRLVSSGAILGFTVRAHQDIEADSIRAVMMIEVVGRNTAKIIHQLRGIPQLERLHTTNGKWDLVAEIRTSNLQEFDRILSVVREIEGVLSSETSILLSTI